MTQKKLLDNEEAAIRRSLRGLALGFGLILLPLLPLGMIHGAMYLHTGQIQKGWGIQLAIAICLATAFVGAGVVVFRNGRPSDSFSSRLRGVALACAVSAAVLVIAYRIYTPTASARLAEELMLITLSLTVSVFTGVNAAITLRLLSTLPATYVPHFSFSDSRTRAKMLLALIILFPVFLIAGATGFDYAWQAGAIALVCILAVTAFLSISLFGLSSVLTQRFPQPPLSEDAGETSPFVSTRFFKSGH